MTTAKTIIILGGGIGGTVAVTRLRKQLPPEHRIILIERESQYAFSPSFPWLMVGKRLAKNITRSRTKLLKLGIELIQGVIEEIDASQRSVRVNGLELSADYLLIALGAEMAPETIPGLSEAGHTFIPSRVLND